jgi:hypothetical protein
MCAQSHHLQHPNHFMNHNNEYIRPCASIQALIQACPVKARSGAWTKHASALKYNDSRPPDAPNAPWLSCRSTAAPPASSASTTAVCPFSAAMFRGDIPAQGEGPVQQLGGGELSKVRHTMRCRTTTKATNAGSPEEGVRFDDYSTNYKSSIRISSRHNSDEYTKCYIYSSKIYLAAMHCCFILRIVVSHTTHLTHWWCTAHTLRVPSNPKIA